MISRAQRGLDGRTAFELRRGKPYRKPLPSITEAAMYLPTGKRVSTLRDRWLVGLFLGVQDCSDEVVIGTEMGVFKARSIKRMEPTLRGNADLLGKIKGSPWDPVPGSIVDSQPDVIVRVVADKVVPEADLPPPVRKPEGVPRRLYIRREVELRRYGYTDGCEGCIAAACGNVPVPHTLACRTRIEKEMEKDDTFSSSRDRLAGHRRKRTDEAGVEETPEEKAAKVEITIVPKRVAEVDSSELDRGRGDGVNPLDTGGAASSRDAMLLGAMIGAIGGDGGVDFMEVFNPGVFEREAPRYGLVPGMAIDLRTGWDLDVKSQRDKAWEALEDRNPEYVILSPRCTPFSTLMNLRPKQFETPEYQETLRSCMMHLQFCVKIMHRQVDRGKKFLFEHPWGA
jgi:hypothetical protein